LVIQYYSQELFLFLSVYYFDFNANVNLLTKRILRKRLRWFAMLKMISGNIQSHLSFIILCSFFNKNIATL